MRIKIFTAKGEEMKKEPNNLKTVWRVILRVKNIFANKLPKRNEVNFSFSDIQRAFKAFVDDKSFFRRVFFNETPKRTVNFRFFNIGVFYFNRNQFIARTCDKVHLGFFFRSPVIYFCSRKQKFYFQNVKDKILENKSGTVHLRGFSK